MQVLQYIDGFFLSSRRRHTRYIGDWSSDVCSSDLDSPAPDDLRSGTRARALAERLGGGGGDAAGGRGGGGDRPQAGHAPVHRRGQGEGVVPRGRGLRLQLLRGGGSGRAAPAAARGRSEEHTSELQ